MKEIIDFLSDLRANNNREWFAANKSRYDAVRALVMELTQQLIDVVAEIDPRAAMLSPADCTYRIYRDTRFSSDKTPYKQHIGIFINPPFGKKSLRCGYYLHIEPGNCFFAAGTIGHPAPVLKAIRRSIYDEIDEYLELISDPEFKAVFANIGDSPLKTAPKGFPKDWEHIDLLKPRNYVAFSGNLESALLRTKDIPKFLRPYIQQSARFNRFVNYAIDPFEGLEE